MSEKIIPQQVKEFLRKKIPLLLPFLEKYSGWNFLDTPKTKDSVPSTETESQRLQTTQRNLKAAYDRYSLQKLCSYDLYDPDSQLFINQKSLGWGLMVSPATGSDEAFVQILANILTDVLPVHSDVQILLWGSPKIGWGLDQTLQNSARRGGEFAHLAEIQIEYLKQGATHSLCPSSDYFLRDLQLFIFFSVSKQHPDANLETLIQLREDVMSSLKSIHLGSDIISVEILLAFLSELLSPNQQVDCESTVWNRHDPLSQQITDTEQLLEVHPQHLLFKKEINEKNEMNERNKTTSKTNEKNEKNGKNEKNKKNEIYARSYSVKSYPKLQTQWGMNEAIGALFNPSLQIPCPYLLSLHIHLLDPHKTQQRAQSKILGKDKKSRNHQMLTWLPSLGREYQDWNWVRERLNEGGRLVHTFFQIILFDHPESLSRSERKLRDLYQANSWKLRVESYLQLQSFLAALPFMMSEGLYEDLKYFGRLKTMTAFNAVNCAPLQGEWKGYPNPLVILPGRRGQVCGWNPFANDQGNYNVAIAAGSGKGKSVFVQYYLTALLGSGGRCWVIDMGHSYEKTCRILQGEFISFSLEKPLCLNFFTAIRTEAEFKEQLPLLVPLIACMARQKTETSEEEDRFIEKAISQAWEQKGNHATITTIKNDLEAAQHPVATNLAHLLTSYAQGGMYADFFEGECSIHFDNPFIVLELLELKNKKSLQRVVLLALMTRIHQAMYLSNRNQCKSCIIDEAWDLLGDESTNAAKFIETGYRTARRHNANFVSITQSIQDYYKNATSQAAFMNADFTVVLGQKAQDIDQLEKNDRFPVDGFIKRLLKSLRMVDQEYSECMIQSPHGISVHRIVLAPYIRVLFSSKGPEFEAVHQLQKQGYSLQEAVCIVAEQSKERAI